MYSIIYDILACIGIVIVGIGLVNAFLYLYNKAKKHCHPTGCQQCGYHTPAGYQFCSSVCENKWLESHEPRFKGKIQNN